MKKGHKMQEITLEDIKIILLALFKNKLMIVLCTVAGLCVGFIYHARQPVFYMYSSTATVSVVFDVSSNQGQISSTAILANYAEIVTSDRVCEYAAEILADEGLSARQIQGMISTGTRVNSYVLRITARNASPRLAILVANAVAESFVTQVSVITGNDSIQVLDAANRASMSSSGRDNRIRILAPAAAFLAACVLVAIIEIALGKVRSVKQCVTDMGELLAVIPKARKKK
jgi:capsular polysaccharide biosynthesis protein